MKCGVVNYTRIIYRFLGPAMNILDELTVPQAASYLNVSKETIRRNIMSKRLRALRK